MTRRLFASLALAVVLCLPGLATTYYINQLADPGGDGTTQELTGAHCAFQTIAAAQAAVTGDQHGNSLLIAKGTPAPVYREQYTCPAYGTAAGQFTFGAYGTGDDPIISGADIITGWSAANVDDIFDNFDDNNTTGWTKAGSTFTAQNERLEVSINTTGGAGWNKLYRDGGTDRTEMWARCRLTMTNVTTTQATVALFGIGGTGATTQIFQIGGMASGANLTLWYIYLNDATTVYGNTSQVIVTGTEYVLTLHWKAATGAGNNDGVLEAWIDGGTLDNTKIVNLSNIDNDTKTADGLSVGFYVPANHVWSYIIDDAQLSINPFPPNTWVRAGQTYDAPIFLDDVYCPFASALGLMRMGEVISDAGTNSAYMRLTTDPDSSVVELANGSAGRREGIVLTTRSYVTLDGLKIEKHYNNNVFWDSNATIVLGNTINNCTLKFAGLCGVKSGVGDTNKSQASFTIQDNTISLFDRRAALWYPAISIFGNNSAGEGDDLLISRNTIYSDITGENTNLSRSGMIIAVGDDIVIEDNEIYGVDHGIELRGTGSIQTPVGYVGTFIVRRNHIHDLADDLVWYDGMAASSDSQTYYNILTNGTDDGISLAGDCGSFYNNVISNITNISLVLNAGSSAVFFKNNIIINWGGKAVDATNAPYLGSSTLDYNCYYDVGGTTPLAAVNISSYNTLALYQAGTGQEVHSIAINPSFISATDFHLLSTSPCINAGTDVGLTQDYAGTRVPQGPKPDIGAYERLRSKFILFLGGLSWQ